MTSPTERRRLKPLRLVLFALVATSLVLGGLNVGVEVLERRGVVETHRVDDHVQFLEEPLFRREGQDYVTTDYAQRFLVPQRFAVEKGDRFRVFLLGASFAMGTPYTSQSHGEERPGGMATWLREDLEARFGPGRFEVVNVAAGAQTSHRVARIADEVLKLAPDLLIVATCNNEGPPKPGYVREQLHQLGAYRLLAKLVAPPREAAERPVFTPQLMAPERVRGEFEENLHSMVDAASRADVPVALATLPLNLRYGGEGAPLPPGDAQGAHEEKPCVRKGRELYEEGDLDAALTALGECSGDIPDAARWTGLTLAALGRVSDAKTALELSVELLPRNRCRPSLNTVTRSLAASRDSVYLVDLERVAQEVSPQGLPGANLFVDYCHLNWRGYATMTQALTRDLESSGLLPPREGPPVDVEAVARSKGIPESF